jgi:hypothetical protein
LLNAGDDSKTFHHRYERVAVQESSPQNNFRRVIAALIPAGEFCNHKINYVPTHKCLLPLKFVATLLNSDLIDWYFRLGSTNAAVSHYQLLNLPCPNFNLAAAQPSASAFTQASPLIRKGELAAVETCLARLVDRPPFDLTIAFIIAAVVDEIIKAEHERGTIPRSARCQLAPKAQAWQDLIDRTFALMAGITAAEHAALRERLAKML